jgi:predicted enzyme related to lactoylglutathione lyase
MTTRNTTHAGQPCWADLWTSDVEGSRRFYAELFGWTALEPSAEFGGYWMFERNGAPTAGGMGPMGDMKAGDTWKPYFGTDDIEASVKRAEAAGAQVVGGAMPVADLGVQAVLVDPTGAGFGLWQPGTFQGFGVIGEPGAPSWFELHTRDHPAAVAFYEELFGFDINRVADTDEFRYFTFRLRGSDEDLGGIMDSRQWVPEGGAHWAIYWGVADAGAAVDRVKSLGGTVKQGPDDTPYGVLVLCADPAGAEFKLQQPPG